MLMMHSDWDAIVWWLVLSSSKVTGVTGPAHPWVYLIYTRYLIYKGMSYSLSLTVLYMVKLKFTAPNDFETFKHFPPSPSLFFRCSSFRIKKKIKVHCNPSTLNICQYPVYITQ